VQGAVYYEIQDTITPLWGMSGLDYKGVARLYKVSGANGFLAKQGSYRDGCSHSLNEWGFESPRVKRINKLLKRFLKHCKIFETLRKSVSYEKVCWWRKLWRATVRKIKN